MRLHDPLSKEHTMLGEARVLLIEPDGREIPMSCKRCRKILATTKDKFMVGVIVKDQGQSFSYFLGVDPPIMCCGEEKSIIKTFDTDKEAEAEIARVLAHIDKFHSTEGLRLLAFSHFGMN